MRQEDFPRKYPEEVAEMRLGGTHCPSSASSPMNDYSDLARRDDPTNFIDNELPVAIAA
jgi:hypothetical protein